MSESETDETASISNDNSSAESEVESDVDADCGVVNIGIASESTAAFDADIVFSPYQDEPIIGDSIQEEQEDEVDIDGISPDILEARFEKRIPLNEWCSCNKCESTLLNGMREHRCCSEVQAAVGKLLFDGSIEWIKCITQHEDYQSLTKTVVLMNVGPLLKDRQGRSYKQKAGEGKNGYLRAVAYRWVIRYIFGFLGWDNTRPLPACVYHDIRTRFSTGKSTGYASALERQ